MYRACLFLVFLFSSTFIHSQPIIYIGAPLPLTGKLALEAAKQKRGYDLWANLVNEQGGIKIGEINHHIKIIYSDYQSDSWKSRQAVEDLIQKNNVNLLFAPYGSEATRTSSAVAQKYSIPMIAVTASSHQAYSRGHSYLFGVFTPNKTLVEPLMDVVKQAIPEVNNIALIVRKDLFPLSIAREVISSSEKRGIKIISYEKYSIGTSDYSSLLKQLKELNPTWICALGYNADLVLLRKQMSEYGISAPILTMLAAPAYQEFIDATGLLSENVTSTSWWHPAVQYKSKDTFGTTKNFVQLFQDRYGKLPDYVEASAALAGVLFQLAIERSQSIEGKLVRDELAKIDETTFWGPVRFGENGQNNAQAPLVFQIQKGKPVIIYPERIALGELKLGAN